jgi:hypothetical protein
MQQFLFAARSMLRRKFQPHRKMIVNTAADLVEFAHWIERPPLRLLVPTSLLRMQGGFAYGPLHPFVAALNNGQTEFERFYSSFQPKNICEFYNIAADVRAGSDLPPWEIPWYGRADRRPPPGELNLSAEHGVSFYGPVTEKKLALEMERLTNLVRSVRSNGFDPDAFGDIQGYILRHENEACFFVRGGKHRAAVLTHLGHTHIPVTFRATLPRLVDGSQAQSWPLVRSGKLDISLAKDILEVYVRGRIENRKS